MGEQADHSRAPEFRVPETLQPFAASILDVLGFGVVIIEAHTHQILYANQAVLRMSGFEWNELEGRQCHRLLCPSELGRCPMTDLGQRIDNSERKILTCMGEQIPIIKTVVLFQAEGQSYLIESFVDNSERDAFQARLREINLSLRDEIRQRVEMEDRLKHLSYHDGLTGLPNRLLFREHLESSIATNGRQQKTFAVVLVDIGALKVVNDTLGHLYGDRVLVEMAERLSRCLRKADRIARLGGDEFVVLAEGVESFRAVEIIVLKMLACIAKPLTLNGNEYFFTASVGVALFPGDGDAADDLLKHADVAMHKAKEKGKNQYVFCTSEMKSTLVENVDLTNKLHRALERNELEIYYQPQVLAATGRIVGVEALLRWNHPELGMISPSKFIPLAEQSGLIIPIGDWVIRTACLQSRRWEEAGYSGLRMAINLSVKQFQKADVVQKVRRALLDSGATPASIELEITESVAMRETRHVVAALSELRALGLCIAIDDFGTDYSSLSHVKSLPIDRIKIAMPFVQGLERYEKDEEIIRAIVRMAKGMGLGVIAEGVETAFQRDCLVELECDEIQGYYFHRPMPADAMKKLLERQASEVW